LLGLGDAGPPQTFEPRLFGPAYEMQRGRMSCGTIRHGGVGGMSGSLTTGSFKSVLTIVRNSVMSDYEMVDIGAGCGVVLLCSFAYGATGLIPNDKSYVSSRGSSMLGLSLPLVQ